MVTGNAGDKEITFVIYDGVCNSVFHSQVLTPILQLLQEMGDIEVTLVSFERHAISKDMLQKLIPAHDRLHFVLCKKVPFLGRLSLLFAVYQFTRMYRHMRTDHIIARGPLAGWIAMISLNKLYYVIPRSYRAVHYRYLPPLTVQARGLAAEEFRFAQERLSGSFFKSLFFQYRYQAYKNIEREVYRRKSHDDFPQEVMIETVSPALREYLIESFGADPARTVVSRYDVPKKIPQELRLLYRKQVREQLGIAPDRYVYCYSGSCQAWQCIDEMIAYFAAQRTRQPESFFLILTRDIGAFEEKLRSAKISPDNYVVMSVEPSQIYRFLCAGDAGLLFREVDPINWVSRPTKMLEYQAVGLTIIHNNTVASLVAQKKPEIEAITMFFPQKTS